MSTISHSRISPLFSVKLSSLHRWIISRNALWCLSVFHIHNRNYTLSTNTDYNNHYQASKQHHPYMNPVFDDQPFEDINREHRSTKIIRGHKNYVSSLKEIIWYLLHATSQFPKGQWPRLVVVICTSNHLQFHSQWFFAQTKQHKVTLGDFWYQPRRV